MVNRRGMNFNQNLKFDLRPNKTYLDHTRTGIKLNPWLVDTPRHFILNLPKVFITHSKLKIAILMKWYKN